MLVGEQCYEGEFASFLGIGWSRSDQPSKDVKLQTNMGVVVQWWNPWWMTFYDSPKDVALSNFMTTNETFRNKRVLHQNLFRNLFAKNHFWKISHGIKKTSIFIHFHGLSRTPWHPIVSDLWKKSPGTLGDSWPRKVQICPSANATTQSQTGEGSVALDGKWGPPAICSKIGRLRVFGWGFLLYPFVSFVS